MTPQQHRLFTFIKNHIAEHGYSPSVREMADAIDSASWGSTQDMVERLIKQGHIVRSGEHVRGLRIADKTPKAITEAIVARAMALSGHQATGDSRINLTAEQLHAIVLGMLR